MPPDEAIDYADDPGDLRPGFLDGACVSLEPLFFLCLVLSPCLFFSPPLFVWALVGVLACQVPRARWNAWVLLIIMAAPTVIIVGLLVAASLPRF